MRELVKGTINGGGKWLTWTQFLEWLREQKAQDAKALVGTFAVTHVFPPSRFPSATLVFWVDELDNGVKKSVPPQEWGALSSLFTPGKPVKGITLYISFDGEGGYSILADDTPQAVYMPTQSGGWELV